MAASVPASRNVVDADGHVIRVYDLYHRTDPAAARAILASGRFESHCQNTHEAYFTNVADGRNARRYGDAVVHVQVPTVVAVPDEKFKDGEIFYRVPVPELSRDRILGATSTETPETDRPGERPPHEPSRGALEERRQLGMTAPPGYRLNP
ncbi:hypothetical protein [Janibacter alittae]|uniref:Uncharacterized protein n=1 Tax=Janibacter alittae TaxID=3115209 RepID=A0ABZ2MLM4_9MICO